jgi:hypothetical protein
LLLGLWSCGRRDAAVHQIHSLSPENDTASDER